MGVIANLFTYKIMLPKLFNDIIDPKLDLDFIEPRNRERAERNYLSKPKSCNYAMFSCRKCE